MVFVVGVVIARVEGGSSDSIGRGSMNSDAQPLHFWIMKLPGGSTKYSRSMTSVRYGHVSLEPQMGHWAGSSPSPTRFPWDRVPRRCPAPTPYAGPLPD